MTVHQQRRYFLFSFLYRFTCKIRQAIMACLFLQLSFSPAYATDALDIATGLKTWPFLSNRPSGPIVIAVLFDPASSESRADAETIKSDIEGKAGSSEVFGVGAKLKLVSISDISALPGVTIAFLAKDIPPGNFDAISSTASANHILSISTDLRCVQTHKCILGIVSKPRVEIYYSSQAAKASSISFTSTFNMLVKQI